MGRVQNALGSDIFVNFIVDGITSAGFNLNRTRSAKGTRQDGREKVANFTLLES